jgi:hypothetical protein
VPDPAEIARKLKLLWSSCGDQDGLITISRGLHRYLKENNVPHIRNVEPGKHDFKVWKNDLYQFSQLIVKVVKFESKISEANNPQRSLRNRGKMDTTRYQPRSGLNIFKI